MPEIDIGGFSREGLDIFRQSNKIKLISSMEQFYICSMWMQREIFSTKLDMGSGTIIKYIISQIVKFYYKLIKESLHLPQQTLTIK